MLLKIILIFASNLEKYLFTSYDHMRTHRDDKELFKRKFYAVH